MLVLLRGTGDEVILTVEGQPDIRLRILRIEDGCVRLGISADPSVSIIRAELMTNDPKALRRHPYATPTVPPQQRPQRNRQRDWRSEKRD